MTERRAQPDRRAHPIRREAGRRASDHGTRACYQGGCGCTPCKAANASYVAQLRRLHVHGTAPLGALVPGHDTAVLIRRMKAEWLNQRQIAALLGLRRPRVELHTGPDQLIRLKSRLRIQRLARKYLSEGGLSL